MTLRGFGAVFIVFTKVFIMYPFVFFLHLIIALYFLVGDVFIHSMCITNHTPLFPTSHESCPEMTTVPRKWKIKNAMPPRTNMGKPLSECHNSPFMSFL